MLSAQGNVVKKTKLTRRFSAENYASCPLFNIVKLDTDDLSMKHVAFPKAEIKGDFYNHQQDKSKETEDPPHGRSYDPLIGIEFYRVFESATLAVDSVETDLNDRQREACEWANNFLLNKASAVLGELWAKQKNSVNDNKPKPSNMSEKEFNIYIAKEILQPLGGGPCVVNHIDKEPRVTHVVSHRTMHWDGVSLGFIDGFYGEPDIIVCPPDEEDEDPTIVLTGRKQQMETAADVDIENEHEKHSPGKTVVEGEKSGSVKCTETVVGLSQCIATLFSFSLIQNYRSKGKLNVFPLLKMSPEFVYVLIYDRERDMLLSMPLEWGSKDVFFIIWAALHYYLFPFNFKCIPKNLQSGFQNLLHNKGFMKEDKFKYLVSQQSFNLEHHIQHVHKFVYKLQ